MCAVKRCSFFSFAHSLSQAPKLIWLPFFVVVVVVFTIVKWYGPLFRYSTLSVSGVHAIICITLIYITIVCVMYIFLLFFPILSLISATTLLLNFVLWWRETHFYFFSLFLSRLCRYSLKNIRRIAWTTVRKIERINHLEIFITELRLNLWLARYC